MLKASLQIGVFLKKHALLISVTMGTALYLLLAIYMMLGEKAQAFPAGIYEAVPIVTASPVPSPVP